MPRWLTTPRRLGAGCLAKPLADNGGLASMLAPMTGSPLVGAADPAVCGGDHAASKEQRSLGRSSTRCTLGTVEAEPAVESPDISA